MPEQLKTLLGVVDAVGVRRVCEAELANRTKSNGKAKDKNKNKAGNKGVDEGEVTLSDAASDDDDSESGSEDDEDMVTPAQVL